MSKPANVDIHNLFRKFGGDPNDYQEIKQNDAEDQALQNWPIISAMKSELQNSSRSAQPTPAAPFRRHPESAPQPVAPQHSVSSFLGTLQSASAPAEQPPAPEAAPAPVDNGMRRTDSLNEVFLRLHGTDQQNHEVPNNDLRNMLGRLIK